MKIRQGFVSNSSSSSFICMVSGGVEAGMDMNLDEAGMIECVQGHEFYDQYLVGTYKAKDEDNVYHDEWRYEVPSEHCPICTMTHLNDATILAYLIKTDNINTKMLMNKIRQDFGSYKELMDSLKS
jgi:hypothetical protein